MSESDEAEINKLVKDAAVKLAEHFDCVQILVTKHKGGEEVTQSFEHGVGNFYARLGHVREWLCLQDQFQRNHAIRKDAE